MVGGPLAWNGAHREPVAINHRLSYRLQLRGAHYDLFVWVNGGCAGNLCVREDEVDVLRAMTKMLDANGAKDLDMEKRLEQADARAEAGRKRDDG